MKPENCPKSLEDLFNEFERTLNPWKKASLAWKIIFCSLYSVENQSFDSSHSPRFK